MSEEPGDAMQTETPAPPEQDQSDSEQLVDGEATLRLPKGISEQEASRLMAELDEQRRMLGELALNLDNCQVEDVLRVYESFGQELRKLSAERGAFKTLGYAGVLSLPMVIGAIISNLQEMLPTECQPQESQRSELCMNVLRRLDPAYAGSPCSVIVLAEFIKQKSFMLENSTVLRKQDEMWIRDNAQITANELRNALPNLPDSEQANALELLGQLTSLSHGCFPYGYNTETERRYKTLDLDALLHVGQPDPAEAARALEPREAAYLQRNATELLDAMERDEIHKDTNWALHLQQIASGNFPHGFRHKTE